MNTYLVPEYYNDFKCKCSDCRHSCCYGWPVRISMKEYHYLLGVECSPQMRDRLDIALKVCTRTTSPDAYAQISTNYQGMCMLNSEDGLCSLQLELGESVLPNICRLYPRNPRSLLNHNLSSCSNSCEAVIELLHSYQTPIRFEEIQIPIVAPQQIHADDNHLLLCRQSIDIIQDRSSSIKERLLKLGEFLLSTDTLSMDTLTPIPTPKPWYILTLLSKYYEDSLSLEPYAHEIQKYYGITDVDPYSLDIDASYIEQKYLLAKSYYETLDPSWESFLEQLLVNHMFYNTFPYVDLPSMEESYHSLLITYSFIKFHMIGFMYRKEMGASYFDVISALFRLIEHSNFHHKILALCHDYKSDLLNLILAL